MDGGNNKATVVLTAITPYHNGYLNEVGSLSVSLDGAYAQDITKKGDSTALNVIITTKGFYVPGPDPTLAVLGIAAVAGVLGARKLRRD